MNISDIGIDLGSASILIYLKGKGVVLKEPSIAAFDRDANKIKAIGDEARVMLGRTTGNIVGIRPMKNGIISDYAVTEQMLKYFIQKASGRLSFKKPRIAICVPSNVTEVERKAVEDAGYQAGAREVLLVPKPVASAIGAQIDISRPCGKMIVDIGAGTCSAAILSIDGIVVDTTINVGGDSLDAAIVNYARDAQGLIIGERAAEDIKIHVGCAVERPEQKIMEVKGRDLTTGLPKTVRISSEDVREAMKEELGQIVEAVHSVLERTPPELAADIVSRGIVLTGGGSLLDGMEELIEEKTGINTITAENPISAAVIGTGRYAEVIQGNHRTVEG
ncbi:MAG: rod shape-determining protein [Eubacteriales bacterium]|nr:rod shape-determining protein [Eubacteriales bacterium]